jgi:hypothetical protein
MLLAEDDTAGDILECRLSNLPARETAILTLSYVIELSAEPRGAMRFGRSVISLGTPVFSTNKTDRHETTEIFLKVALNTIILTLTLKLVNNNTIS